MKLFPDLLLLGLIVLSLGLVGCATFKSGKEERVRLKEPRIKPLAQSEWNEEQKKILAPMVRDGRVYNIFSTMARHPKMTEKWLTFGTYILRESTLPERDREILILRIGWLCRSEYEFGQHSLIGQRSGLSAEEITRIMEGPEAAGWKPFDAALLRAADELHQDAFITDDTWKALAERYDEKQLMDVVMTVGQYNLVSMLLNSFGVQLDQGISGFPALKK
jgi:4-carboxymuconolactone decarboxylase